MEETIQNWITHNPNLFKQIIALATTVFGICLMIGAVKDWDWIYKEDGHYQNNWDLGQISRYLGRKNARIIGFVGGVFFFGIGLFFCYAVFI